MHLPPHASHLTDFCNPISYSLLSGFRAIHCVIICSSREIDENVNTVKQYLVSSDKTQYFLFLQMTWKSGAISTNHSSLKKNAQPCCPQTLVLICDLKQQTHMPSSKIVDADELNISIISMKSTWQNQSTFAETISFDPLRHRSYYYLWVIERQKKYMQKYMPFSSPFYK